MDGERKGDNPGRQDGCSAQDVADVSAETAAAQTKRRLHAVVETLKRKPRGTPTFIGPLGSEADYVARSEGVKSSRMRRLAREVFVAPAEADPEAVRLLAAAVLAFHAFGK